MWRTRCYGLEIGAGSDIMATRKPASGWSIPRKQRDEYPFDCTKEHRGSIWIGNVPLSEQNEQGRMLNAFFQRNNAARVAAENPTGFRFEARVVNYVPAT
jgi:hypothetical protein